jgi:FdhD protein
VSAKTNAWLLNNIMHVNTPSRLRRTPPATLREKRISPSPQAGEYPEGGRGCLNSLASISVTGTLNNLPSTWSLPEEVPVALHINSKSYTVMMSTPADLEDMAVGFLLSEGIVASEGHITNVLAFPSGEGFTVDAAIEEDKIIRERMITRSMEARVGCGLCGIAEMEDAIRVPKRKRVTPPLDPQAIARALAALPAHQPMNAANRTVHAAAFCTLDGTITLAREDVGRHNALDKLIGAMARAHMEPIGFALMSSRCSFELVQKCATVGITALATVSAPTALAYRLAQQSGLRLASHSRQGVMIFNGDE